MKSKIPPRTHSSGSVLEQSLQVSNYCHKFLMLLKMEERAHAKLLAERSENYLATCMVYSTLYILRIRKS